MNKYEKARMRLLFYALKHDWVKKEVEKNDIDLSGGLSNYCDVEEIKDYIDVLKQERDNKVIDELIGKLLEDMKNTDDREEKVKIAKQIISIKQTME